VIFITGDHSPLLSIKAEKQGAYALLHKPIRVSTLVTMIGSAINAQRRADDTTKVVQRRAS